MVSSFFDGTRKRLVFGKDDEVRKSPEAASENAHATMERISDGRRDATYAAINAMTTNNTRDKIIRFSVGASGSKNAK
jgi:hypothetical protein